MQLTNFLSRHAQQQPDAPAVVGNNGHLDYATWLKRVDAATAFLMKQGVVCADVVALGLPQSTLWQSAFNLAAWRLGATAVVLGGEAVAGLRALPAAHRLHVLCIEGAALSRLPGVNAITLSPEALKSLQVTQMVIGLPEFEAANASAGQIYLGGSHRGGNLRAVRLDADQMLARLQAVADLAGLNAHTRLLAHLGMAAPLAQDFLFATWLSGGSVLLAPDTAPFGEVLSLLQPDCLLLSRRRLDDALNAAKDAGNIATANRRLFVAGGPLSVEKAKLAQQALAASVSLLLDTAETGVFCVGTLDDLVAHGGAVGRVVPGVNVRSVDQQGNAVAGGQAGRLQLHSPLAGGDWFPIGLAGRVGGDGFLYVMSADASASSPEPGRGGRMLTRSEIETAVGQLDGVDEVCVLSQDLPGAKSIPVLVFSGAAGADMAALKRRIAELQLGLLPFHMVRIKSLPRGKDGGVLREQLATDVTAAIRKSMVPLNHPDADTTGASAA